MSRESLTRSRCVRFSGILLSGIRGGSEGGCASHGVGVFWVLRPVSRGSFACTDRTMVLSFSAAHD
jgi:hypothetical protein